MGGRLRDWWERLTGRGGEEPAVPHSTKQQRPPELQPPPEKPGELSVADKDAAAAKQAHRVGAGGFDPYSSDAGFQKPHSWEHVDRD